MLIFLIDQKRCNEAKACASASIVQLKNIIRRAVDFLASRLYFYYSLRYELTGGLSEIRGKSFAGKRGRGGRGAWLYCETVKDS
ncbi:hypothetical protein ACB092_07G182800 [Castanea dentata]